VTLSIIAFVVAEAVPIFNYLLGLAGSLCIASFSLIYLTLLWMYDFNAYRSGYLGQRMFFGFNAVIRAIGLFMVVAGTYVESVSSIEIERKLTHA